VTLFNLQTTERYAGHVLVIPHDRWDTHLLSDISFALGIDAIFALQIAVNFSDRSSYYSGSGSSSSSSNNNS
jgi:hypothetical protein